MRSVLLSLFVVLLGALIGAVAGFLLVIGIALATNADMRDGGVAMGAAFVGAPFGAVVGASLGLMGAIRWHRRPPGKPFLSGPLAATVFGVPLMIALGLGLRIWSVTIPEFRPPYPELLLEVRVAKGAIDESRTRFKPLFPLLAYADGYVTPYEVLSQSTDAAYDMARLRYMIVYKADTHEIRLEVERDTFAVFPLQIGRIPVPTDRFTDWQAPSAQRIEQSGQVPQIGPTDRHDVAIRYRLHWEGH